MSCVSLSTAGDAMLGELFYWVFNMSITASVSGVVVLLLTRIKKLPRTFAVWLWIIPFLRMVLPIGLSGKYSFMTLMSKLGTKTVTVYETELPLTIMNHIGAADSYFPITYEVKFFKELFDTAAVIWLAVTVAILLSMAAVYITTVREMHDSVPLRENICISEKITSPAVYGILKPRIILPASYADRDLELVLLHERMHIRALDNLRRLAAFVITAVHWFDPLAWVFLRFLLADIELSCDARVLSVIGEDRAKEYALKLLESKRGSAVFASAFRGAGIRRRIENILSFRKITALSLAFFILFVAAIFYLLLTNGYMKG